MKEVLNDNPEVVFLPPRLVGTQNYSLKVTPEIINGYAEIGLSNEILPILARHMADLHIVTDYVSDSSSLAVGAILNSDDEQEWRRYIKISERQFSRYSGLLETVFEQQSVKDKSFEQIGALAVNWIYYELSADALANSCYMQSKFNKYIPDYNGNSPHYRSDLTLSRRFLTDQIDDDKISLRLIEHDHSSFSAGIGLLFLKDALLRANTVKRSHHADWITRSIELAYPNLNASTYDTSPMGQYELINRMEYAQPVDGVVISTQRFAEMLEDPDED